MDGLLESGLAPGALLGKYRIVRQLGAGAMGQVLLAVDEGLGRKVAIKVLAPDHAGDPELRERFVREARAVAQISHPNIVQVFGIDAFDGRPYFAMEYLPGRDLGALVREQGPVSQEEAVRMVLDAARGLREAARAGIIHRDVKPSNLVLTDRREVKVTDFGLAKAKNDAALTQAGMVLGTPDYIAPEQARGEVLEPRTDVYALGCTLFHLISGRPPYRRPEDREDRYLKVVTRHITAPIPDLRDEAPAVDPQIADLCRRMMAKRPEDRPRYDSLIPTLEALYLGLAEHDAEGSVSIAAVTDLGVAGPSRRARRMALAGTAVSASLFLAAVGLTLRQAARNADAAEAALADEQARPGVAIEPPSGFLRVDPPDGRAAYVAAHVVTRGDWDRIMEPGVPIDANDAGAPMTGVSYVDAADYAMRTGARIVHDDELEAASRMPGFAPPGGHLCEWVWDEDRPHEQRFLRCEGFARRDLAETASSPSVTFRVALDPAVVARAARTGDPP